VSLDQRAARYRPLIERELREVVGSDGSRLFSWMRYHLGWEDASGAAVEAPPGKLMRPVALLLATELLDGHVEDALPAAAAVELVHNFSLLHDDVEDQSARRRGRQTLWTLTGVAHAINTGDGMYTLARLAMYRLLERGVEETLVLRAMGELDRACARLVEGQFADLELEGHIDATPEEYVAMSAGKSAAMFAAPFAMGALLAGASGRTVQALRAFGHHVGLAFQAVDDILGIWGDPELTLKPVGDDLRSRKLTYPVIAALACGGDEAHALAEAYASPLPPGGVDDVPRLTALVERLGGRPATEAFAAEQQRMALDALQLLRLDGAALADLREFAEIATARVT
jgi:geranylgeranyl diphosphate synthase type I